MTPQAEQNLMNTLAGFKAYIASLEIPEKDPYSTLIKGTIDGYRDSVSYNEFRNWWAVVQRTKDPRVLPELTDSDLQAFFSLVPSSIFRGYEKNRVTLGTLQKTWKWMTAALWEIPVFGCVSQTSDQNNYQENRPFAPTSINVLAKIPIRVEERFGADVLLIAEKSGEPSQLFSVNTGSKVVKDMKIGKTYEIKGRVMTTDFLVAGRKTTRVGYVKLVL